MSAEKWRIHPEAGPFRPMKELEEMRRLFEEDILKPVMRAIGERVPVETTGWSPSVDAYDTSEAFILNIELPGVSQDDVDLSVSETALVIKGVRNQGPAVDEVDFHLREISQGNFFRSIALPKGINIDAIEAVYENGILRVTMGKEKAGKSRKIDIQTL